MKPAQKESLGLSRSGAGFSPRDNEDKSLPRVGFTQGKLHETQRWLLLRRAIQERDGNAEPAAVLDARGAQHAEASPKRMREIGQQHWEHPGPGLRLHPSHQTPFSRHKSARGTSAHLPAQFQPQILLPSPSVEAFHQTELFGEKREQTSTCSPRSLGRRRRQRLAWG